MRRKSETAALVDWLHTHNARHDAAGQAGFYGLDLYDLRGSIAVTPPGPRPAVAGALETRPFGV